MESFACTQVVSCNVHSKIPCIHSFSHFSYPPPISILSSYLSFSPTTKQLHSRLRRRAMLTIQNNASKSKPLKIITFGAPPSQCKLVAKKYGLVHISAHEVAADTEIGEKAKDYMEKGMLVPEDIVTKLVKNRLIQQDALENGWILDGYPQNLVQAKVLKELRIRPDIVLFQDAKSQGNVYEHTVKELLHFYKEFVKKIDGNRPEYEILQEIDVILTKILDGGFLDSNNQKYSALPRSDVKNNWKGIPTRLNNIPHSRTIRQYFYEDVKHATVRGIEDGLTRLKIEINIPELNANTDVYRIGTLLELVRVLALNFAFDGKRVKVCVQSPMGEGALVGMPLQLAGTKRILENMDWGEHGAMGTFINIGFIGAKEVTEQDDMFILLAPQNIVGSCIITDMQEMSEAAGSRPIMLINPVLKDIPSSGGVMTTIGREERLNFARIFSTCYLFRLLYTAGTQYPIMGAVRMSYPSSYELYKRVDIEQGKEEYVCVATFNTMPTSKQINDALDGRLGAKDDKPKGLWGLLSGII